MYRVNYDSSKQAASTTVSIRVGDGAVLVDSTYFSHGPTVTVTPGNAAVVEGGTAFIPITLSDTQSVPVVVNWESINNTAISGTDFTGGVGQATIPRGTFTGYIQVSTTNRASCQQPRAFYIHLTGANPSDVIPLSNYGNVTITDDDCGTVNSRGYSGSVSISGSVQP